jgi:hypothetical protein
MRTLRRRKTRMATDLIAEMRRVSPTTVWSGGMKMYDADGVGVGVGPGTTKGNIRPYLP